MNTQQTVESVLRDAGWVETTLGECRTGESVYVTQFGVPGTLVQAEWPTDTKTEAQLKGCADMNFAYKLTEPVLRAPRPEPEYLAGTLAIVHMVEEEPFMALRTEDQQWVDTNAVIIRSTVTVREVLYNPAVTDAEVVDDEPAPLTLDDLRAHPGRVAVDNDGEYWRYKNGNIHFAGWTADAPKWSGYVHAKNFFAAAQDVHWADTPKEGQA